MQSYDDSYGTCLVGVDASDAVGKLSLFVVSIFLNFQCTFVLLEMSSCIIFSL